jgi:hypothetical protein
MATVFQFLQHTVGVDNGVVRQTLAQAGFNDLDFVYKQELKWSDGVCDGVLKSRVGPPEQRHISVNSILILKKFVLYQKIRYLSGRTRTYANSTLARMNAVYDWYSQLEKDPDDTVANFTDRCNKRLWLESIHQYLSSTKGAALVPLGYVLREQQRPVPVPNFGQPTYDEEVATRGRLDGHFWNADNRSVWLFLRQKCHGTTAWTVIVEFQRTNDGRAAYQALVGQYLGRDYQRSMLKRAVKMLDEMRFDGKSKNFPFDIFVGRVRQCFIDMGPDNQLSEERKVMALQAAWQVPNLQYLDAMMQRDYSNDFNGAVNFLAEQMSGLKLKNGPLARSIDSAKTVPDEAPADPDLVSKLKRQVKSLEAKRKKGYSNQKSDKKTAVSRKKPSAKYSSKDPSAYVSKDAWNKMSDEQKAAARASRSAAGIPQRKVSSISVRRSPAVARMPAPSDDDMDVDDDTVQISNVRQRTIRFADETVYNSDDEDGDKKMPAVVVPPQVLVAPRVKKLITTQRAATYANKPKKNPPKDPPKDGSKKQD